MHRDHIAERGLERTTAVGVDLDGRALVIVGPATWYENRGAESGEQQVSGRRQGHSCIIVTTWPTSASY